MAPDDLRRLPQAGLRLYGEDLRESALKPKEQTCKNLQLSCRRAASLAVIEAAVSGIEQDWLQTYEKNTCSMHRQNHSKVIRQAAATNCANVKATYSESYGGNSNKWD